MLLKSTYTFNPAHKFLSDLGSVDNGRSASLTGKTCTNGVFNAAATSLVATAAVACNALAIFQHTGSDATARVIAYLDGRFRFVLSAGASGGATSISVDSLLYALASGIVATKISGSGPSTITTSAPAVVGANTVSVVSLGGAAGQDDVYEIDVSGNTNPFTPGVGQTVNITWDPGANKIFHI
jgi:hypothetical protein